MASPIDIIIFAPLAPIFGVVLFWFIQLLFIESQKYMLSKIRADHESFCRFTNFIGIFFQTVCHALGYTVTNHGISNFHVSVHYGKVAPKKKKSGVFEWFSNGFLFLGPFFIPPSLLLICLLFLIHDGFVLFPIEAYTFAENLIVFGSNLYQFSSAFFIFLSTIDFLHPGHLGFFVLFILLGLGIRPSYIKEKTIRKVDIFYDLKNIRYKILHKPLYVLLFLLSAYIFSYLSVLLHLNWYVGIFSIFGWISIIAISAILFAHIIILYIDVTDHITGAFRYLTLLIFPITYILFRVLFYFVPISFATMISLILSIVITIALIVYLLYRVTNTFKFNESMNLRKKFK